MFDPKSYTPALAPLLAVDRNRPLGPGRAIACNALDALSIEQALAPYQIADEEMAQLCLASVWLLYDNLDASHVISQSVETPTGSYWHGIMHRREPDYGNSKYWFRRVGRHPIFGSLGEFVTATAPKEAASQAARKMASASSWDPFLFVDLCEQAERDSTGQAYCRQVAAREWELLFDYTLRAAIGA